MASRRLFIPLPAKYLSCSCLYLLMISTCFGQWQWLNPKPSGYSNGKVTFVNHQTGFILNSVGDLYTTNDAGVSWRLLRNFSKVICMDFADSTGVIAGYNGAVYLSPDNGNHWAMVQTNFNDAIETINIVSRDTIFVSNGFNNTSKNGNIYQTTDRGKTWAAFHCNTPIHALTFVDSKTGFAGGPQSTILKTTDGGVTWVQKRKLNIVPSSIICMQFLDQDTGYAFQESDTLLSTTDGGESWIPSTAGYTMRDMHFINSKDGYLGGDYGAIVATHDGGKTFSWIGFDGLRDGNTIRSVHFLTRDTGFAVGGLGRIIKTTDGGLHWLAYNSFTYLPITAISFGAATTGYATTANNIYKTSDKGQTWKVLDLTVGTIYPSQRQFTHAYFTSADTGFVIASKPVQVYHTVDGGSSWQVFSLPQALANYSDNVSAMHFINATTGFISIYKNVYNGSTILKTSDGGITWYQVSAPTNNNNFKSIYYTSEDTGYGVTYSQVFKTTDSSRTWAPIYTGDYTELGSVVFTSAKDGFVSKNDNKMLVTTDTGKTWKQVILPSYGQVGLQTIGFYNKQVGYYIGNGSIYQTIDSGSTWQWRKYASANSIVFTPDSSVVFAGVGGLILSSSIKEIYADSIQFIKPRSNCGSELSAVVGAVLSSADSISFYVTSQGGNTYSFPANPNAVSNGRITVNAGTTGLIKDSLYAVSLRYFSDGAYRYTNSTDLRFGGNLNNWLGEVSASWETAANWSCGTVPDGNSDVVVSCYTPRCPIISSNALCKTMNLSAGSTLKVNPGFTLTITGK